MRNNPALIAEKIAAKYRRTAQLAADAAVIPYKSADGHWIISPHDGNSWWTSGFWPGLMWLLHRETGDPFFVEEALRTEKLLIDELRVFRHLHHDVGFMYLLSCGAHHKLLGDEQAGLDTLHAASILMGRYNPVGYIRAWNDPGKIGYAIIDCMMNLSLLFRASRDTDDPRFAKIACLHADMSIREFLREDGSVSHIVEFDPQTGERVRELGGQGYGQGSSWSRGQAWGLYGFTLAYLNTREKRYLETAEKIAGYFIAHIREDGLTDSDFCQPKGEERIDNLAGVIAACGLIELSKAAQNPEYQKQAERLLDGVIDHCCDFTDEYCGILTHCTASYHDDGAGRHTNIVYGDYFFMEALLKLNEKDPMLWL